jgi:hypothetical protein
MNSKTNYGQSGCKDATWIKGKVIKNKSPNSWRTDAGNNLIKYSDYNNNKSKYCWDIDHIIPKSSGGTDYINNLQPLQSKMNRGCGNSENKPGLDKQILHDARKCKYNARNERNTIINQNKNRNKIIKLIENTIMYVKQSPLTEPQLATILYIHKNEVTVLWLYSNYKQNIVLDKDLFLEVSTTRTRRTHSKN